MAVQPKTISKDCDHSYTLELRLTENSTNTVNNTSSVSWSLVLVSGGYSFSQYRIGWSVSLNGSVVSSQNWSTSTQRSISSNGKLTIASGTNTIMHNADGTLNMAATASMEISKSSYGPVDGSSGTGTVSLSGSMALTTIPRASTMSVPTFTAGTAGTLTISRASSSFTHTIQYKFGSVSWTSIATKTTSTSVSWTPPVSLLQQMASSTSKTETDGLRLLTYSGNTLIGEKYYNLTIQAGNSAKPTATLTVSPDNSGQNDTVRGWGYYIKGLSKISYTIGFSGYQGSTVSAREFIGNGQTLTSASGTTKLIGSSGTLSLKARVKDSRNRWSDYVSKSITVYDYSQPTISSISVYRCTSTGTASSSGTYIRLYCSASRGASINNKNTIHISYTVKQGSTTKASGTLTSGTATVLSGYDITQSYSVTITVTDSVGSSITRILGIPSEVVTFHMKEGGDGVAFGGYATVPNAVDFTGWSPIGMVLGFGKAKARIPEHTDLNAMTEPGVYSVTSSTQAQTLSNCPSIYAGTLRIWASEGVIGSASTAWHRVIQEYIDYKCNIYIRGIYSGETAGQYTYETWKKITTVAIQ